MPGSLHSSIFPALLPELRAIRSFVEGFCAAANVAEEAGLKLNLVLEELFTNTVKHGHGEDAGAFVWIGLSRADEGLRIVYEDSAPAFNPYAWLAAVMRGDPERRPGGLGILLTRELVASREYGYIFGRNCIRLGMRLD